MNAYEKAQQLLQLIETEALPFEPEYTLPSQRYARVGTGVISCASVQVAALDMSPDGLDNGQVTVHCDAIQLSNFACIISRDCSFVANEDGSDDPKRVGEASALGAKDAQFLWNWAQHYDAYFSKQFSVGWIFTGGILITTLSLTTGVD